MTIDDKQKLEEITRVYRISDTVIGMPVLISKEAADQYPDKEREPSQAPVRTYETRPENSFVDEIEDNMPLPKNYERIGSVLAVIHKGAFTGYLLTKNDGNIFINKRPTNNIETYPIQVLDSTHTLYGSCPGVKLKDKTRIVEPHKFRDGKYHKKNVEELCQNCTDEYAKLVKGE